MYKAVNNFEKRIYKISNTELYIDDFLCEVVYDIGNLDTIDIIKK